MNPQQSSVQLPPHLVERLLSSSGEAAWNDWDWRNPEWLEWAVSGLAGCG